MRMVPSAIKSKVFRIALQDDRDRRCTSFLDCTRMFDNNMFMRGQLLSEVLEALIVIRGLIACIGGLQIHGEKRGRSNLALKNSYVYTAKKLVLPSWLILFEYKNVNTVWFEEGHGIFK
nr:hypothetical protein [Tanacetum cinerariifolium]